jgi:biopolymer transport protein ExbD
MEFERKRRRHTHIDIAPLVDVVFNLLLFFVITYNVVADPAIKIRLPHSVTADTQAQEPIVITISREGNTYVGDQLVATGEVASMVRQRFSENRELSVKIKADQDVPVRLLVQVVDGVKLAGCSAFSIVTQRNEGGSP